MANGILQSTAITQTLANFYISLHSYWSSTVLLTSAPTWFDTMMTNKALLCELTATLRQMDWNNTKTAWKTSHVKAKQLYQTIRPFWWRSYYLDFRLHILWISLYAEPNKTQDTSSCEVMHFNNHFYFRPPGFETAQFCFQNKDAISYQTFTGNALTLSKYNQSAMTKKLKLQYAKQI